MTTNPSPGIVERLAMIGAAMIAIGLTGFVCISLWAIRDEIRELRKALSTYHGDRT